MSDEQLITISQLIPVEYHDTIPKASLLPFFEYVFQRDIYGKNIDICDAAEEVFSQIYYKKGEYRSEEEWRIIDLSLSHKISFPYVTAVYSGLKISEDNKDELKKICKDKNIPLFQQEKDLMSGNMRYMLVND